MKDFLLTLLYASLAIGWVYFVVTNVIPFAMLRVGLQ